MPSAFSSGIPLDSPFNISGSSGSGMVMPDAFPGGVIADHPRKSSGGRKNRHDHNPLSQGYPMKLAPVPEQSDPVDDVFVDSYNGRKKQRHGDVMYNGGGWDDEESSSGGSTEETDILMFPSADLASSNSQLQRQRGMRKKSGTRRMENGWSQSSQDAMVYSNRGALRDDVPERDDIPDYMAQASPRQKGKFLRQQAREREVTKQKERLKKQAEEDERRRILQQQERAAKIARDYGSTHFREVDIDEQVQMSQNGGRVFQEAMRLEAQLQLKQEKGLRSSQSQGSRERMSQEKQLVSPKRQTSRSRVVNSYDQFTTI